MPTPNTPLWFAIVVLIVGPVWGFLAARWAYKGQLHPLLVAVIVGVVVVNGAFDWAGKIAAWGWPP